MNSTNHVLRFLLRGLQVILLAAVLAGIPFFAIRPDKKHFYQGSLLKRNLLRTVPGARVILVGGSNLAFGIDSEMMEQALGMPVINDGMHVGLGVAPIEELKTYIHPGDVIVVSLEYYNFLDETSFFGDGPYLADWVEVAPERIRYLHDPLREIPVVYTFMLQRKINRQLNYFLYGGTLDPIRNGYTGDKFNAHGDFTGHLAPDAPHFAIPNSIYPINYFPAGYAYLADFKAFAESKGAQVFFEAQASRQTNCDLTGMKPLRKFYADLQKKSKIPLLTGIDQICLPDQYFYDTPNHLNAAGRPIKTQHLIDNLKHALGMQ